MSVTLSCAAKVSAGCLTRCKRQVGIEALELTLTHYLPDFLLIEFSTGSSFPVCVRVICRYRSGDSGQIAGGEFRITPGPQRVRRQWKVGCLRKRASCRVFLQLFRKHSKKATHQQELIDRGGK